MAKPQKKTTSKGASRKTAASAASKAAGARKAPAKKAARKAAAKKAPRAAAKKAPTVKAAAKKAPQAPFLKEDAYEAFVHFRPIVEKHPEGQLEIWNADPDLVLTNVQRGVAALAPHWAAVRKAMPRLDVNRLQEMPALCLAMGYAARQVAPAASSGEILARQQRVRKVRRQTLPVLEVLAERGVLPADAVRKIRAGSGPLDEAADAVAIAGTFKDHAQALAGKHPFTDAELAQLAEDGNWLLVQLTPSEATPAKGERNPAVVLRDRFWTEVVSRFDDLYKAGVEVWGRRGVDGHLPALLSRTRAPATQSPARPAPVAEAAPPA